MLCENPLQVVLKTVFRKWVNRQNLTERARPGRSNVRNCPTAGQLNGAALVGACCARGRALSDRFSDAPAWEQDRRAFR
jgi:hypothetical protein